MLKGLIEDIKHLIIRYCPDCCSRMKRTGRRIKPVVCSTQVSWKCRNCGRRWITETRIIKSDI